VVRVTVQALAAVLGGTQSLHTNGYDEALALPAEVSAKLALRTQQILAAESGVTRTADPLGGSWYVEALTDEIEARVRSYLERIAELGGASRALEYMQEEIHRAAYAVQREIESGERAVVGVNVNEEDEGPARIGRPDYSTLEQAQKAALMARKASRDGAGVARALARVRETARGTENLMPPVVEAVKAEATLGEISDALRAEWGVHDR
jgi:methylmalonyl-CoA mutase N-terminal domain/subunit